MNLIDKLTDALEQALTALDAGNAETPANSRWPKLHAVLRHTKAISSILPLMPEVTLESGERGGVVLLDNDGHEIAAISRVRNSERPLSDDEWVQLLYTIYVGLLVACPTTTESQTK